MALKTVYLYPTQWFPFGLEPAPQDPEAAMADDGDASWTSFEGYQFADYAGFDVSEIPHSAQILSVRADARVEADAGGDGIRFSLAQAYPTAQVDFLPSDGQERITLALATNSVVVSEGILGPLVAVPWTRSLVESARVGFGFGSFRLYFTRLAVTYDDGEPDPGPSPEPEPAEVIISDTHHIADGEPHGVTVTTDPPGLTTAVTYDGSPVPPSEVGTYAVLATVTEPGYVGAAAAVLTIAPAGGIVDPEMEILSGGHITEGDTLPALRGRITSKGQPVDLTGRTVKITIAPGPGYPPLLSREAVLADEPGEWVLPWQPGETAGRGKSAFEVQASIDGQQCAPAQGYGLVQIQRRLG